MNKFCEESTAACSLILIGIAGFLLVTSHAQAADSVVLPGHVPAAVTTLHLQPAGRLAATTNLYLAIGLPLRNQEQLNQLLQDLYNPASPKYRHFLTPDQFATEFGPTVADYQALADFAQAHGLQVVGRHPNRLILDVTGKVADIEQTLHVTMLTYQHPVENRPFYAPDVDPSVALAVPILHIMGLDNYARPRPRLHHAPHGQARNATAKSGSGPEGDYMGPDFRAAYVPGVTLTGSGQTIGLLEFDGYYATDITAYEKTNNLPNVTLQKVLLDGFDGTPTTGPNSGNDEVALDIELSIAMAPGSSRILVYEAGLNGNQDDVLSAMAGGNARQLSCSWGLDGPDPTADQLFQQMATQGQSFYNASGDSDAFVGDTTIDFPSDDPYITQVGGTTLSTAGPGGSYQSETVWNSHFVPGSGGGYFGSSGGISTIYSIPSWQKGIIMTASQGSTTMRNIPDVAMVANNVTIIADDGQVESVFGTSCAAPLWAGFTALINQQAVANGMSTVGFVNPALYTIGKGANYDSCFHDITTGNNEWPQSPTMFVAVAGYDLCTGWGTPSGVNLINALAGPLGADLAVSLSVSPDPVVAGEPMLYTIDVTNFGPLTATSVTVTDTLPATATFVSAAASRGSATHAGGLVIGSLGTLTANSGAIVQIQVVPTAAGVIANTVTASATQPDPNPANNTASVMTTVLSPPVLGVSPASYDFGSEPTGTTALTILVVTNSGGATLTGTATATASGGIFSVANGSAFSIPGAGSASVVVGFTPASSSESIGSVVFTSNGGGFTNSLTGTGTFSASVTNTTPPTLIVLNPANDQVVTNAAQTVNGLVSDASGISSVIVNGAAASLTGITWSASLTLVPGTNTITVIATDASVNQNTATQIVQSVFMRPNDQGAVFNAVPLVTNALFQVGNVAVVVPGQTNYFVVSATDLAGDPLTYQWTFGDGTSTGWLATNSASHAYGPDCGPYLASVAASDGQVINSENLTVTAACQMTLTTLRVKLNFVKASADTCSLKALLDLGAGYDLVSKLVTVNISGAAAQFTLDADGKGHGFGQNGTCKFSYQKKTGLWLFTANMKNGAWNAAWASQGLIDATIRPAAAVSLTASVLVDSDAFAAASTLSYTAKASKSGTAK